MKCLDSCMPCLVKNIFFKSSPFFLSNKPSKGQTQLANSFQTEGQAYIK